MSSRKQQATERIKIEENLDKLKSKPFCHGDTEYKEKVKNVKQGNSKTLKRRNAQAALLSKVASDLSLTRFSCF